MTADRSAMHLPRAHAGFTLVELMVTVVVAAILLSLAVPSFHGTLIRNRLATATNEFMGAINYARSEAIKRRGSITLCKSSTGIGCTMTGSEWEHGWIAFVDRDPYGSRDSDETLLRVWSALPSGYTLRTSSSNFTNHLRYNALGAVANSSVGGTFALCHNNQRTGARAIIITPLRPRLGLDANGDRIPEKENNTNISTCEAP